MKRRGIKRLTGANLLATSLTSSTLRPAPLNSAGRGGWPGRQEQGREEKKKGAQFHGGGIFNEPAARIFPVQRESEQWETCGCLLKWN